MTPSQLQTITRRHAKTLDDIITLFQKAGITAVEGEAILLHLAGLSAGNRQQSITDGEWNLPLTIAWGFAAEMGTG